MTHGPTKIASKGACIYCGATGVDLTDEHIVPYALGGQHILLNASCKPCAAITSKFEMHVARDLWGIARTRYNEKSRRKKKRPSHVSLPPSRMNASPLIVPVSEYPAPMIFYQMDKAGILAGDAESVDRSKHWTLVAVTDNNQIEAFEKKYPGRLTVSFKNIPDSFARLIAKIGYGQVLTALDPGDFTPIILPYILGRKTNLSYVVGGKPTIDPPLPGTGYSMTTVAMGTEDKLLLIADIRLYASNYTPTYHAVVGEVIGRDRVVAVKSKLGCEFVGLGKSVPSIAQPNVPHWLPRIWRQ